KRFLEIRKHLPGVYRDAVDVLAATGRHAREVARFARAGEVQPIPKGREGEGAAVLWFPLTKARVPGTTIVSKKAAAAARRLRAHGGLSLQYLRRALHRACRAADEKAKREEIALCHPQWFRQSVVTYAHEHGATIEAAGDFVGHEMWRTTRRFYALHAIPPKVTTMI